MLYARSTYSIGIGPLISSTAAKYSFLPRILPAPPIDCSQGPIEVRMLLHRKKFLEGLWALYSFAWHCPQPLRVIVHSDGSLDDACGRQLSSILPGSTLVHKEQADRQVVPDLQARGLDRCLLWRRRTIFARKVLDFLSMSLAKCYITIDSDVLTFSTPRPLLGDPDSERSRQLHMYSLDNNDHRYSLPEALLAERTGQPVLHRLNAGLVKVWRQRIDLADIENVLRKTNILNDSSANMYYSEQAVYACALATGGAVPLDEKLYTLCGDPKEIVTGHYCGGGYWASRFYREGLPFLCKKIGL